jgi:hypothetical protein
VKADPTLSAWPVVEAQYGVLRGRLLRAAAEPRYQAAWFHHAAATCPFADKKEGKRATMLAAGACCTCTVRERTPRPLQQG